jgi:hypothetical protein
LKLIYHNNVKNLLILPPRYAIIATVVNAGVAESADARDLKSLGSNTVPVQVWSPAPKKKPDVYGMFRIHRVFSLGYKIAYSLFS